MQLTKSKFNEAFGKILNKKKHSGNSSNPYDTYSDDDDESIKSYRTNKGSRRASSLPSDMFRKSSYGIRCTLDFSGLTMPRFAYDKRSNKENFGDQTNRSDMTVNSNDSRTQNDPLKAQVSLN